MPEEAEAGNLFEYEGKTFWWKACTVSGCPNYICNGFSEEHCYVHLSPDQRTRKDADLAANP